MGADSGSFQSPLSFDQLVDPPGFHQGDSEFVLVQAGGDVGMSFRGNVRIDAQCTRAVRLSAAARRASTANSLSLSTLNSRILARRAASISSDVLPTPENRPCPRTTIHRQHPLQFSARDYVIAAP